MSDRVRCNAGDFACDVTDAGAVLCDGTNVSPSVTYTGCYVYSNGDIGCR